MLARILLVKYVKSWKKAHQKLTLEVESFLIRHFMALVYWEWVVLMSQLRKICKSLDIDIVLFLLLVVHFIFQSVCVITHILCSPSKGGNSDNRVMQSLIHRIPEWTTEPAVQSLEIVQSRAEKKSYCKTLLVSID